MGGSTDFDVILGQRLHVERQKWETERQRISQENSRLQQQIVELGSELQQKSQALATASSSSPPPVETSAGDAANLVCPNCSSLISNAKAAAPTPKAPPAKSA